MDLLFIVLNNRFMDYNEVAIFIKVVQKESFSKAAIALDMPKSTVSTKVSNLEKRLGTTLLKRSTRKLQLTEDGTIFFQRAIKGINEILAAENEIISENSEPHGQLKITAPIDIGNIVLTELTANFLKKYPKVNIKIILSDRYVDFLEEEIDLAIRAGTLKDSTLIAKKIGEVAFGIYASPKHLKTHGVPNAPKDLKSHHCILFSSISEWKLHNAKQSITVAPHERIVVNDLNLAMSLAVQGEGLALLPSFLCQPEIKSGKLVRVLKGWKSNVSPIHFVYPTQRHVQPAVKMFIEMSTALMQNRFKLTEE